MQLIEKKPPAKRPFKRLLIAFGVDVLLFATCILWLRPTLDDSIIEFLLLWGIFISNICLAVASRFSIKVLYHVFLINSVLASLLFHLMFIGWLNIVK